MRAKEKDGRGSIRPGQAGSWTPGPGTWLWWRWVVRLAGAGLLAAMGGIHIYLYQLGYATVPTIGPLFLADGVLGAIAALILLVVPAKWLRAAAVLGALLQLGTLGALLLSLAVGMFGFRETLDAPLVGRTLIVETAGFLLLTAYAVIGEPAQNRVRGRGRGYGHD